MATYFCSKDHEKHLSYRYPDFILLTQDIHPQSASGLYTIPVVVHIIHNNGPENISDSLVHSALAEVNRNYSATNAGWLASLHPLYQS